MRSSYYILKTGQIVDMFQTKRKLSTKEKRRRLLKVMDEYDSIYELARIEMSGSIPYKVNKALGEFTQKVIKS